MTNFLLLQESTTYNRITADNDADKFDMHVAFYFMKLSMNRCTFIVFTELKKNVINIISIFAINCR